MTEQDKQMNEMRRELDRLRAENEELQVLIKEMLADLTEVVIPNAPVINKRHKQWGN